MLNCHTISNSCVQSFFIPSVLQCFFVYCLVPINGSSCVLRACAYDNYIKRCTAAITVLHTLDEKLNLPQICLVQTCCKHEICKALQPVQRWQWPNLPVFVANSAIATFALVAKLCKFHICIIFAPGKFGANSIFHPVISPFFS